MCQTIFGNGSTKTEREQLEEALDRPSVREHEFCADGKIIIEAARKWLATLPKPKRKVRVEYWLVTSKLGAWGPFSDRFDAECTHRRNKDDSQIVKLAGEYEE